MALESVLVTVIILLTILGSLLVHRFKLLDRWGPKKKLYIIIMVSGLLCILILFEPEPFEPVWPVIGLAGCMFYGIQKAWLEWRESVSAPASTDV